jgi:hypothetical protein
MAYDILIKEARTRFSQEELLDIGIKDSRIDKIGAGLGDDAKQTIDADGKLVSESFVNGHLHLCKVYTLTMVEDDTLSTYTSGSMGGAMTAIEQAARIKERYDESWIIENVRKAVRLAVNSKTKLISRWWHFRRTVWSETPVLRITSGRLWSWVPTSWEAFHGSNTRTRTPGRTSI